MQNDGRYNSVLTFRFLPNRDATSKAGGHGDTQGIEEDRSYPLD